MLPRCLFETQNGRTKDEMHQALFLIEISVTLAGRAVLLIIHPLLQWQSLLSGGI